MTRLASAGSPELPEAVRDTPRRSVRRRGQFVGVALSVLAIGSFTGAFPATAEAAVQRAAGGYASTAVSILYTGELKIASTIQADGYARQTVAAMPQLYDYTSGQWKDWGWKYCDLNANVGTWAGGSGWGFNCTRDWLARPPAGKYYISMLYSWYTPAGWQSYRDNLGDVYIR